MSDLADLAVIIYGMIAVIIEKGLDVMFWALERRKQRREAFRAEVIAEGLALGRAEGRTEILAELQAKAHLRENGESIADWLDRMARELEDSVKK